jgi:exodeoxyribonuclease VII small subunit
MSEHPYLSEPPSSPLPAEGTLPAGWNYEATVAEVEAIIQRIEQGELDLADLFDQFSIAVDRLRQCEAFLTRQQQQVDVLVETLLDEPDVG